MASFLIPTNIFLNGLRFTKQEVISDGLGWSLSETALNIVSFGAQNDDWNVIIVQFYGHLSS
jgi:hypothetical protein